MIHFGTGGFRGVIGDDFTKENVKRIAQAISDVIHEDNSKKPVVMAMISVLVRMPLRFTGRIL